MIIYPEVSTPAENKALVHRLLEIVNAGEPGAIDEVARGRDRRGGSALCGPFRKSFLDLTWRWSMS